MKFESGNALSIKEIAKLAGVSTATVSMALNNKDGRYRVSAKTQAKVEALALEHGYTASSAARSLRTRKTKTIGLLLPALVGSFFGNLYPEVARKLQEHGYRPLVTGSDYSREQEQDLLQDLLNFPVDGLLLSSSTPQIKLPKVAAVFIDTKDSSCEAPFVHSDNCQGAYLLTRSLIEAGCRDIAFIGGLDTYISSRQRFEGFVRALGEEGLKPRSDFIYRDKFDRQFSRKVMRKILSREQKPDGLLLSDFVSAEGALQELIHNAPGELNRFHYACFDNGLAPSLFPRDKTWIYEQDLAAIATRACDILFDLIEGGSHDLDPVIVPGTLICPGEELSLV